MESAGKTLPGSSVMIPCVVLLSLAPDDLRRAVHVKQSLLVCRS